MPELMRNIPNRNLIVFIIIIVISFLLMIGYVSASSIDSIQLLKISPQDQRAVIKTTDGKMKVIKTGDIFPVAGSGLRVENEKDGKRVAGSGLRVENEKDKKQAAGSELRVVEIAEGRVVFEEQTEHGTETVIIRLEGDNAGSGLRDAGSESKKKQKIERIKKAGEKQQQLYAVKTPQEQKAQMKAPVKEKTRKKDRK